MNRYMEAGLRIQTCIAALVDENPAYPPVLITNLRTAIDLLKADIMGLVDALSDKGVLTKEDFLAASAASAEREAAAYEAEVGAVLK